MFYGVELLLTLFQEQRIYERTKNEEKNTFQIQYKRKQKN